VGITPHGKLLLDRPVKLAARYDLGEFVDLAAKAYRWRMLDTTFITINPNILGGTPVFAGTRVPVRI
jgi:Protein of unknown function (DUF433)